MNELSAQLTEFLAKYEEFLDKYQWVFEKSRGYVLIPEYIHYFIRKYNDFEYFSYFVVPFMYDLSILDRFKKNVVSISHHIFEGGANLIIIIQISPTCHLIGKVAYINKKMKIGFEIYCKDPAEFPKFVAENKEFSAPELSIPVGFQTSEKKQVDAPRKNG